MKNTEKSKLVEVARGILLEDAIETVSFFGKEKETKYIFREYNGRKRFLTLSTHITNYEANEAAKGDMIVVSKRLYLPFSMRIEDAVISLKKPEWFMRIDIFEAPIPKLKYYYIGPFSEARLK